MTGAEAEHELKSNVAQCEARCVTDDASHVGLGETYESVRKPDAATTQILKFQELRSSS